ncbi:MAG: GGDEF domain-containing protein [Bacilli bacterium]
MKNRKLLALVIVALVLITSVVIVTFFLNPSDETNLSILDKKWIEENKNTIIDSSIINNVSVISNEGEGLIFDFINFIEADTGLEFNKTAHDTYSSDTKGDVVITKVDTYNANDLLLYEDEYVFIGKEDKLYNELTSFNDKNIGIIKSKESEASIKLSDINIKFYDTYEQMKIAFDYKEIDFFMVPRISYIENMINQNLFINYVVLDINDYYVIKLDTKNEKLNNIITKEFNFFKNNKQKKLLNSHIYNIYITAKNITELELTNMKSVVYNYGYIENRPYDSLTNNFINKNIINDFSKFAEVDIKFSEFNSIEALNKKFNDKTLEITTNMYSKTNEKYITSISILTEDLVVITHFENEFSINNINSLSGKEVKTLNMETFNVLENIEDINLIKYSTIHELKNNINKDSIIVLDKNVYNYYKIQYFKDYNIIFDNNNFNVNFLFNSKYSNLTDLFNFFIRMQNMKKYMNYQNEINQSDIINIALPKKTIGIFIIVVIVVTTLLILVGSVFKQNKKISKIDKIKYMDSLTSLKNRSFLNEHVEIWDKSESFPQAVVIIDLNNIQFINDSHGHDEGDLVIGKAANILINEQLPNSEIIRTDGNEFLIYLIGYTDKQIMVFLKKIYRNLKALPYGHGASLGYSMRENSSKTIEDTINEATISMKENKKYEKR